MALLAGCATAVVAIAAPELPGRAPAQTIRTIDDLGLELIRIEPGTFTLGSPSDESGRHRAEGPQTVVTLTQGFWLGKTEVTQKQYAAIVGSNPSHFTEVGENAPVERVSWLDALEYCEKLNERERAAGRLPEGYVYTLPTEAQWEYACRAGTKGTHSGNPATMAWHKGNSGETTHPVAARAPNPWGFYDMYGNVLEWCIDWYGEGYPGGEVTDPRGPASGYFRMARGGSWRVDLFRSASRGGGSPGRRDYTLGFRLALSAAKPAR